MAGEVVELAEIIQVGNANIAGQINKAFPGQVVGYDPATQTADIQPMIKRVLFKDDGTKAYDSLPLLPAVPVVFPRGGGFVVTVPLLAGDFVWVNCSDRGMAEWLATGQESEPWDTRAHHLSGAVCFPGCYPDTRPLASGDNSARSAGMVVGKDGAEEQVRIAPGSIQIGASASDYVALGSLVQTAIDNIRATFNGHTHATAGTGTPSPPILGATAGTLMPPQGPVSAVLVKAK